MEYGEDDEGAMNEEVNDGEEGEFNDIIEEQGIQVGEDWLTNEFITTPEDGTN